MLHAYFSSINKSSYYLIGIKRDDVVKKSRGRGHYKIWSPFSRPFRGIKTCKSLS